MEDRESSVVGPLDNCELYITKQDTRSRSVPEEYLSSIFKTDGQESDTMDSESTDQTNHSSPTMISNYPKNSKIPNCRSLAYRHSTICVEETKFRRTRTVPSESPWGGAYIHPFDLIIPENLRPLGKGYFSEVRVGFFAWRQSSLQKTIGKAF